MYYFIKFVLMDALKDHAGTVLLFKIIQQWKAWSIIVCAPHMCTWLFVYGTCGGGSALTSSRYHDYGLSCFQHASVAPAFLCYFLPSVSCNMLLNTLLDGVIMVYVKSGLIQEIVLFKVVYFWSFLIIVWPI